MTGSTRIKGSALSLSFGGTDYWADVTSLTMTNDAQDSALVTFADAAGVQAQQYSFKGTAIQSGQTSSFWRYAWANAGNDVAFRYAPFGNTTASADQPHFVGTVKISSQRPDIGGDASPTNEFSFDFQWDIDGLPALDDGTDGVPTILEISPTGQSAGDQVIIGGTRFSSATDVKFGTTSATSIIVVSDVTITAVVPTGSGVKAVTVVNTAGTSAAVNYTVAA